MINRVVELAHRHDAFSIVIPFDPRPAFVHGWAGAHNGEEPTQSNVDADALTGIDERLRRLEEFGVDHVLVVHYTLAFADKSYIFFLGQLTGKLGMRTLVLGQDAAWARDAQAMSSISPTSPPPPVSLNLMWLMTVSWRSAYSA